MKRATTVEFGLYAKKINILIEEAYEEGYQDATENLKTHKHGITQHKNQHRKNTPN